MCFLSCQERLTGAQLSRPLNFALLDAIVLLKMWLDPGALPQLAGLHEARLHIPPIGSQLVHSLSIRTGCGTRFRGMRSLTFAACGNKTLFSIIFTTSPLAKSWIRAWVYGFICMPNTIFCPSLSAGFKL